MNRSIFDGSLLKRNHPFQRSALSGVDDGCVTQGNVQLQALGTDISNLDLTRREVYIIGKGDVMEATADRGRSNHILGVQLYLVQGDAFHSDP